jgi:hypothetical protein
MSGLSVAFDQRSVMTPTLRSGRGSAKGFRGARARRTVEAVSIRVRRTLVAAAVTLVSVTWGASASAAPRQDKPVHSPLVITHHMSSCGHMDGY